MENSTYNSGDLILFKLKESNKSQEGFFVNTKETGDVVFSRDSSKTYFIGQVKITKLVETAKYRMIKRYFRLFITFPIAIFIFIALIFTAICEIISESYDYWNDKLMKYEKWLGK